MLHAFGHELADAYDTATLYPAGVCAVAQVAGGWAVEGDDAAAVEAARLVLSDAGLHVVRTGACQVLKTYEITPG